MEEVFETPEKTDFYMISTSSSSMIEPILDGKFGNEFHHNNPPNQR